MFKYLIALLFYSFTFHAMSSSLEKPYHHITNDKGNTISFRNPEGSPQRDSSFNWSFKVFNEEKKKLNTDVPPDHVIDKKEVLIPFVDKIIESVDHLNKRIYVKIPKGLLDLNFISDNNVFCLSDSDSCLSLGIGTIK